MTLKTLFVAPLELVFHQNSVPETSLPIYINHDMKSYILKQDFSLHISSLYGVTMQCQHV